jgi:hypothetical protein
MALFCAIVHFPTFKKVSIFAFLSIFTFGSLYFSVHVPIVLKVNSSVFLRHSVALALFSSVVRPIIVEDQLFSFAKPVGSSGSL